MFRSASNRERLALLLAATWGGAALAQSVPSFQSAAGSDCGTTLTPEDVARILENARAGRYDSAQIAGFEFWYIPVSTHVVRRSDGSGGLSESRLAAALNDMNAEFSAAGMVFFRAGPTRYIDSNAFYNDIDTLAEIDALRQTDVIFGAVNMYFTEHLAMENVGGLCGISSFTSSAVQGIVMANGCTGLSDNHSTVPHEVGHFFDLFHTHETFFGEECVDGSNCATAGDLLCDTPADPELSGKVNGDCEYTGSDQDSCNNDPYSPLPRNLMSYSRKECRNAFTSQQLDRARATNINLRTELQSTSIASDTATFVNGDFPDGGPGTPFFPYDTLAEGLQNALAGGVIIVGAGQYPGPLNINQHVTLCASRGLVRIGG